MKNLATACMRLALLSAVLAVAPLVHSQTNPPVLPTWPAGEASPLFQRHHAMAGIMKDMVREMSGMQEEMEKGAPAPDMRRQMAAKMKRMSEMMQRMSGLADRPTMKEPEARKQYEEMRRQMDEMSRSPSMSNPGRSK